LPISAESAIQSTKLSNEKEKIMNKSLVARPKANRRSYISCSGKSSNAVSKIK